MLDHLAAARRRIRQAAEHQDGSASQLADALRGATHPDAQHAHAHHAAARDHTRTALASTDRAEQQLRAYLQVVQGADRPPLPIPDDVIEQTRTGMPHAPERAKTTGWWLRPDGGRVRIRSGQDDNPNGWQQQAERLLRGTFPYGGQFLAALRSQVIYVGRRVE